MTEARNPEQLRRLEPAVAGRPDAMMALARQYAAIGETETAIGLAEQARDLAPGDGETATLAAELLSDGVPSWHFGLLRDDIRNQAYDAAIRSAVTPGCTVFEIGTGSGILAMMAARAGARVVTCEASPQVAAAARDVIAANGLADRITVIGKPSFAVEVADLGGPADLLVSEIVSNDLLSEGVLPAHGDAVARLLRPGAAAVPARGTIRVALAEDAHWAEARVGDVSGFDLSRYNRVARPYRMARAGGAPIALRSDALDLFEFDFAAPGPWRDRRTRQGLTAAGGTVNGIVQWIALDLGGGATYENRPGTTDFSCWAPLFWPFAESVDTRPGDTIAIGAYHTEDRVRMWREPAL